jgi:hypothetical protein
MYDFPQKPAQAIIQLAIKPMLSSIVKIQPKKEVESYDQLICTQDDKDTIYEIISTIAENGKLTLLFKQTDLRDLGEKIDHLHPLKFLTSIFTNPKLKVDMVNVFDDFFKRAGFMEGLGPNLTKEAEKEKLNQYIGDFAAEVGVTEEGIKPYFEQRDWEGLVIYLIQS